MWTNIIIAAEEQELLNTLVKALKNRYNGNTFLEVFYEDLINGFKKRVSKIAQAIKKNECVLFIGPELLQCIDNGKMEAFNRYFSLQLSATLNNKGVYFDENSKDSL